MNTGELWFVRSKNKHSPEVELVEIVYLNGNVVGFGEAYYDLRLLDFVGRNYEQEEKRAQERFLETYLPEPEPPYVFEDVEQVESTTTKLSCWERFKLWYITYTFVF